MVRGPIKTLASFIMFKTSLCSTPCSPPCCDRATNTISLTSPDTTIEKWMSRYASQRGRHDMLPRKVVQTCIPERQLLGTVVCRCRFRSLCKSGVALRLASPTKNTVIMYHVETSHFLIHGQQDSELRQKRMKISYAHNIIHFKPIR